LIFSNVRLLSVQPNVHLQALTTSALEDASTLFHRRHTALLKPLANGRPVLHHTIRTKRLSGAVLFQPSGGEHVWCSKTWWGPHLFCVPSVWSARVGSDNSQCINAAQISIIPVQVKWGNYL